jgi:rubredoxin
MVASNIQEGNLVPPESACPNCKQRDADRLEWIDDDQVQCLSCWTLYTPNKGDPAHDR